MKIQCDVCNKDEALLFCTADDAALCSSCDHRLHHPNLPSSNHHRFPLLHPSNNHHFPLCDICQERRAFLFCQQDRVILCKDCDLPIHSANHLTQNHQRFLLTGLKLSSISASLPVPLSANTSSVVESSTSTTLTPTVDDVKGSRAINGVAEYLIDPFPDWHFEEFLDSSSTTAPPLHFSEASNSPFT